MDLFVCNNFLIRKMCVHVLYIELRNVGNVFANKHEYVFVLICRGVFPVWVYWLC